MLILVAIILGGIQHFSGFNIYGSEDNKWYFYSAVVIIGLIGIALVAWFFMKKETPQKEQTPATPT